MDYKERIQAIAEELAQERYGCGFYDLREPGRVQVYRDAEERVSESYAATADER